MKISYSWLKEYVKFDVAPEQVAKYLTDCGLEVEALETFERVKGGLKGLVIGEVLTCEEHPDSDHLHITTVNVGGDRPLDVVCGAPNVAAGQKVVVATIGTVLYSGDESFTIKKSKIRGVPSEGMICAEDEIGLGSSHDGIMVLPEDAVVGTPASEYFKLESDTIFEIGLTPNRSDAICHFGVARDLYAMLKLNGEKCSSLARPIASEVKPNALSNKVKRIEVVVENKTACPRYSGLCFDNVTVKESPEWLQTRLKSIGVRPINNIVDITQYIMFEIGQPLHAFDADKIEGNKVIVKNLSEGTPFVTLDGNEVKLSAEDLMICNEKEGMCIAGVFGGLHSGVTTNTKRIFLESAYFNPTSIRKTSKRHTLKTDAAFRYERGCDPEITTYALKRAANLIHELAGAAVVSDIIDVYPTRIERSKITLRYDQINRVAGKEIDKEKVSEILSLLGMEVQACGAEQLMVTAPLNKADVTRPIDLIEEILRIYGYNNIEIPDTLTYNIGLVAAKSGASVANRISNYLTDNGFFEVMNNTLTKSAYAQKFDFIDENESVALVNPLSNELNVLRQTLLFSGLENIVRNINNKNSNLRLFEFGKTYRRNTQDRQTEVTQQFTEENRISMFVTGKNHDTSWNEVEKDNDFFYLKNIFTNLLAKLHFPKEVMTVSMVKDGRFSEALALEFEGKCLAVMGEVHPKVTKYFDIKRPVYFADIDADLLYAAANREKIVFHSMPQYPSVKRDLALVVDASVTYDQLEKIAYKYGSKLLKKVTLFDVYEGDKIENGKKSYALNFVLQHADKTLADEAINKVMSKLIDAFAREAGAKLR
ncbi:MAG: phenylalanine--tRNA ligase subunit beta [Bacteroidales bacterium]|nr:phenylalanine--tRNA ligase subunit beta [Bacteroidales bacterium]